MKTRLLLPTLLAAACSSQGTASPPGRLAIDQVQTSGTLTVTSRDFAAGGAIPKKFSAYGDGMSPRLAWSSLPEGTKSLAIVMEDPDASGSKPFVHWVAWNLDPAAGAVAAGSVTLGARVGRNGRGGQGYFGPHPSNGAVHHYHFELFALDGPLSLKPGSTREQLLAAIRGHVLGEGELVGTFKKP
jgi:Raf kinase inhibitor-like YbhB/YbcL family protein